MNQTISEHEARTRESSPILEIKGLKTFFYTSEGVGRAVDGVSWDLHRKETLGVVGESGCGKSVTALSVLRLVADPPGKIVEGEIFFQGRDLLKISEDEMRGIRGDKISMIFQDPMSSLDPVFTIGDQMSEIFRLHRKTSRRESWEQSIEMLKTVKIPLAEQRVLEYPYQMSGGMQQRVMIAMALACRPQVLIADEPTTALDVTIQAQILDLMLQLKEEFETAIVLITHNLGVVAEVAQRVIVMYAGQVVEEGPVDDIFESPMHPYTQGLLKSIPRLDDQGKRRQRLQEINGVVPSPNDLPTGCLFHPRCLQAMDLCVQETPPFQPITNKTSVRCWHYSK